jgi:hypothetical protein
LQNDIVLLSNLEAFTHPQFFYDNNCKCSRFNSNFLWLDLYDTLYTPVSSGAMPANFDVGHAVTITAKQDDFFRIKFFAIAPNDNDQHLDGKEFWVKKGTLGTWVANLNDSTGEYDPVPLYKDPSETSEINVKLDSVEETVVLILDICKNWMYVETISKERKKRGWLNPKMQFGNPYGSF